MALNTAVSFATNTNWQAYGGETTMSMLTQMLALTVQNFLSAATGMAVAVALIRGLARRETAQLGNFWQDLTRSVLYILLPLSLVLALVLVWQGVPQTLTGSVEAAWLDPAPPAASSTRPDVPAADQPPDRQTIVLGPVASQVAIKQLGTNGGGYYNVNSAHPFENPTPLTNLLEMLAILLIPAAFCHIFGVMVGDRRQGLAILAAMTILFAGFAALTLAAESVPNPALAGLGVQAAPSLEGKEVRFGATGSALWAAATTAASNGSVNAMHDSFSPLGGLWPMLLMQLGEVVYGRGGLGALRHAGLCRGHGLRGRADGRAHAGVLRQEDRTLRDQDGRPGHPHPAVPVPGRHGPGRRGRPGRGRVQPRTAWLFPAALRVFLHGQQQRQRVCRPGREFAPSGPSPGPWPCSCPATG